MLMERLEVTEKKRSEILALNKDVLQSKLELEATLKHERRKLQDVLEGKGNVVLRDRISVLERQVAELTHKEKDAKTNQRVAQKKIDEQAS